MPALVKLLFALAMGGLAVLGWLLVVVVLAGYFTLRGAWLVLAITVHSFRLNPATPLPAAVRAGPARRQYLLGPAFHDLAGVLADVARLTARWLLGAPAVPERYRWPDRPDDRPDERPDDRPDERPDERPRHRHRHRHTAEDPDDRPAVFRPAEGSWLADAAGWGGKDGLLVPVPFLLLHVAQATGLTLGAGAATLTVLTAAALTAAVLAVAAALAGLAGLARGAPTTEGTTGRQPPSVTRARTLMARLALGCLGLVLVAGVLALLHLVLRLVGASP